jgi:hypothetical protein
VPTLPGPDAAARGVLAPWRVRRARRYVVGVRGALGAVESVSGPFRLRDAPPPAAMALHPLPVPGPPGPPGPPHMRGEGGARAAGSEWGGPGRARDEAGRAPTDEAWWRLRDTGGPAGATAELVLARRARLRAAWQPLRRTRRGAQRCIAGPGPVDGGGDGDGAEGAGDGRGGDPGREGGEEGRDPGGPPRPAAGLAAHAAAGAAGAAGAVGAAGPGSAPDAEGGGGAGRGDGGAAGLDAGADARAGRLPGADACAGRLPETAVGQATGAGRTGAGAEDGPAPGAGPAVERDGAAGETDGGTAGAGGAWRRGSDV